MLSIIDVSSSSNSDPGRSGDLSPYIDMGSMYFDDSYYENEMHFKISNILDEMPDDKYDELAIKCDNETEFNDILDKLYHIKSSSVKFYGTSSEPYTIIVAKDPRLKYRKFDEEEFLVSEEEHKQVKAYE